MRASGTTRRLNGSALIAGAALVLIAGAALAERAFETTAAGPVSAAVGALRGEPGLDAAPWRAGFAMAEGEEVRGPRGYYDLCARAAEQCPAPLNPDAPARVKLDAAAWTALNAVNDAVNTGYEPMTDVDAHGKSDYWTLPSEVADCEDFALAKRARLIALGVPPEALLIGVVEGVETDYHAVLLIRTDRGDLVLDNLETAIRPWTATDYVWVIRQSELDPARWVRVSGAETPAERAGRTVSLARERR